MTDGLLSDRVLIGDCIERLRELPAGSVDCIFADPPYNLQLSGELTRTSGARVDGVDDAWDHFDSDAAYEAFTRSWLSEARRVLKDDGTIWVIGSYHNIFTVGYLMTRLGFWILNDVHWVKTNPMPNFRGRRFQNATETMIWAQKKGASGYTFNYHQMKALNDGRQMRNTWDLPICTGRERLTSGGRKLHPTQKPLALLYRVVCAATRPGELILDPFFGTGTTGVAARTLGRRFLGIEQDPAYAAAARDRCAAVVPASDPSTLLTPEPRKARQVPFPRLVEGGWVAIGARLVSPCGRHTAIVQADGTVVSDRTCGSIHAVGRAVQGAASCNGWDFWRLAETGAPLDTLRIAWHESARSAA